MALKELLVATMFVFVIIVFLVAGGPAIDGVADAIQETDTIGGNGEPYDTSGKIQTVQWISLVGVPTLAGIGIVIWAYAAIARRESYRGRGRL